MFDEVDPDTEIEARLGRKFPYSTCGDWVGLAADLPSPSKVLYWLLRMHCNQERGDNRAWPTQATLASMLKLKKASDVGKYTKPLVDIEAVDVEVVRWGPNRMYKRLVYTTHEAPPEGYEGFGSLKDWYTQAKAAAVVALPKPPTKPQVGPVVPSKGGPAPVAKPQVSPDVPPEGPPVVPPDGGPDIPPEAGPVVPQEGHKQTRSENNPKENNPNPGGLTAAPQTPAGLNLDHPPHGVTDQGESKGDPLRAHAEQVPGASNDEGGHVVSGQALTLLPLGRSPKGKGRPLRRRTRR